MYLHIGGGCSVPVKDITMILDCESDMPADTLKTLSKKKSAGPAGEHRSAVVTTDTVYYSPIAKGTLRGRLQALIYPRTI